jgi:hypothetical protein
MNSILKIISGLLFAAVILVILYVAKDELSVGGGCQYMMVQGNCQIVNAEGSKIYFNFFPIGDIDL